MNSEQRQVVKKCMLLDVKEILDDMGIPFWLHSGVLLGYYRNRDLLPHDPDLDIGVDREKLPDDFADKLARRIENTNMRLVWKTNTCLKLRREDADGHYEMHCDIFIHDRKNGRMELELSNAKNTEKHKYIHSDVTFVNKVVFLGEEFVVPDNPLEDVYMSYGPEWMKPVMKYDWNKDPCNMDGRPVEAPDETPKTDVLSETDFTGNTLILGPVSKKDAKLAAKSGNAFVFAEQKAPDGKLEFEFCDETHCVHVIEKHGLGGKCDRVLVPHPELYTEQNLHELLGCAWHALRAGGELVAKTNANINGAMEDFMFEHMAGNTFRKYEKHENWERNVTAVITTFESPEMVSGCVKSIKQHHPGMRIIVVDNSRNAKQVNGAKTVFMHEDAGLSACRNAGVLHVNTPYVLLLDDDQYAMDDTSFKKMYDAVVKNGLDIVGGSVINSKTKVGAAYTGLIKRTASSVELKYGKRGSTPDGTDLVDIVLNFFVAKRDFLKRVKWRRQLKICEHMDFFLRVKDAGGKVGCVVSAKCLHMKHENARTQDYREHRNRVPKFSGLVMRMQGLDSIVDFSGKETTYAQRHGASRQAPPAQQKKTASVVGRNIRRKKSLIERFPELFFHKK